MVTRGGYVGGFRAIGPSLAKELRDPESPGVEGPPGTLEGHELPSPFRERAGFD